MKGSCIKLSEPLRPKEIDKTDDPRYSAYYQMIGHPTKSCYILKDHIQTLMDTNILKLRPEQKQVSANMTSCIHIDLAPPMVTEVESIPQAELRILNLDAGNRNEKGHVSIPTPDEGRMWVHPHLLFANNWSSNTFLKPGGGARKRKAMARERSSQYPSFAMW